MLQTVKKDCDTRVKISDFVIVCRLGDLNLAHNEFILCLMKVVFIHAAFHSFIVIWLDNSSHLTTKQVFAFFMIKLEYIRTFNLLLDSFFPTSRNFLFRMKNWSNGHAFHFNWKHNKSIKYILIIAHSNQSILI